MTTCRDAFLSCLGGIQFKNPKCRHLLLDAAYTAFHNGGDSLTVTQMASTDRGTIGRGNAPLLVAGPQGRSKEMPPRPYHFVLNSCWMACTGVGDLLQVPLTNRGRNKQREKEGKLFTSRVSGIRCSILMGCSCGTDRAVLVERSC